MLVSAQEPARRPSGLCTRLEHVGRISAATRCGVAATVAAARDAHGEPLALIPARNTGGARLALCFCMAVHPVASTHARCAWRLPTLHVFAAVGGVALHEQVLCAFHSYLFTRALFAPASADKPWLCLATLAWLTITIGAVGLRQQAWITHERTRALVYRAGIALPMIGEYLLLASLLPALRLPLADAALLRMDHAVLGTTPALWLERISTPAVVEWFSFFYYGYYLLIGTHIVLALWITPSARSQELLLGLVLVTAFGHAAYTLVPGVGPYAFSGVGFTHALSGGVFFARVQATVAQAGAHLDIFPSLHTAHPVLIALHALRHRTSRIYRFTWPLIVFAAGNMVVSTMLLRFHYAVDVVAGLALACAVSWTVARRVR